MVVVSLCFEVPQSFAALTGEIPAFSYYLAVGPSLKAAEKLSVGFIEDNMLIRAN